MLIVRHTDGMDGLLSAVYAVYAQRLPRQELRFQPLSSPVQDLWAQTQTIAVDQTQAERVGERLHQLLGKEGLRTLLLASLAQHDEVSNVLGQLICASLDQQTNALLHYADAGPMQVSQWAQAVQMEQHRMKAFVRFEAIAQPEDPAMAAPQTLRLKSPETMPAPKRRSQRVRPLEMSAEVLDRTLYFARIEPVHDVLPLIANFFARRFADQRWLIADVGRQYGVYFDRRRCHLVEQMDTDMLHDPRRQYRPEESGLQQMWRAYLGAANIASRANPKLQRRHMPLRYWKHLTEQKGQSSR